jgi:hypothetical protein
MTARLHYQDRLAALVAAARVGPGDFVQVEVAHAPDCALLAGRGPCTCCPTIAANVGGKLWRVDSAGTVFCDATAELH